MQQIQHSQNWIFSIVFRFIFCFILSIVLFLWQVSDFGLAREANFNLEGGKFPIKWTAPEAIKQGVGFVIEKTETFPVFVFGHRNTSVSLREFELLLEHELQASIAHSLLWPHHFVFQWYVVVAARVLVPSIISSDPSPTWRFQGLCLTFEPSRG